MQSSNSIPEHLAWHLFGKTMVSSVPEAFEHVGINTLLHFISHFSHDPFVGFSGVSVKLSSGIEHKASHRFLYVFSFRQKGRYKGLFWNLGWIHSEQDRHSTFCWHKVTKNNTKENVAK